MAQRTIRTGVGASALATAWGCLSLRNSSLLGWDQTKPKETKLFHFVPHFVVSVTLPVAEQADG